MSKTNKLSRRATEKKNFIEARKSLKRMQEEIAPFIKRRQLKQHSTAGEWCETSNICL